MEWLTIVGGRWARVGTLVGRPDAGPILDAYVGPDREAIRNHLGEFADDRVFDIRWRELADAGDDIGSGDRGRTALGGGPSPGPSPTWQDVNWGWRGPISGRALSFVPASLAAVGFLQARRGTCVSRAAEGTFEHDDFSRTEASVPDAARSRRAAGRIVRDTILIGILCAAAGAATALIR